MELLYLTKYDSLGASSRLRTYQYISWWGEHGINACTFPLFSDEYVRQLYRGRIDPLTIVEAYIRRVRIMLSSKRYDLIWLEKEAFPWIPYLLESKLLDRGIPYVVDYDDAVYHRYDQHTNCLVRLLLGSKIDRIMAGAEMVTVGNEYLAQKARRAGAWRVEFVPTVVDLSRYPLQQQPVSDEFIIGWIGSPSTMKYLELIRPALAEICRDGKGRVVLIGSGEVNWPDVPVTSRPWTESTEVDEIMNFDVGIMPLPDEPWTRGKCGYKLIQYMACEKPVVGSPVGVNRELIMDGINGFTATTTEEWVSALTLLRASKEKCRLLGRKGRELVEQKYSLQVTAPRLLSFLLEVTGKGLRKVEM